MKTARTRAVVLRRTNYGEADRIVQLLTPTGRVGIMARGVRKEKSKLAGGIELFAVSDVVIGQGKGELSVLTSARLVQFYRHILEDYDRMQFAYEVLAQVARASESLDAQEWYDITVDVLAALDVPSVPMQLVQTWFYVRMAAMLGEALNTERDVSGAKLSGEKKYRYDSDDKGFVESVKGEIAAEHIKILRLVAAKPLKAIIQIGGLGSYLPECLYVARSAAAL